MMLYSPLVFGFVPVVISTFTLAEWKNNKCKGGKYITHKPIEDINKCKTYCEGREKYNVTAIGYGEYVYDPEYVCRCYLGSASLGKESNDFKCLILSPDAAESSDDASAGADAAESSDDASAGADAAESSDDASAGECKVTFGENCSSKKPFNNNISFSFERGAEKALVNAVLKNRGFTKKKLGRIEVYGDDACEVTLKMKEEAETTTFSPSNGEVKFCSTKAYKKFMDLSKIEITAGEPRIDIK
jgi:hypothetical protein